MSRRDAISPEHRPGLATLSERSLEAVYCPVCGIDLTHAALHERERHADSCATALSQLDHETQEDGNDEIDDEDDELAALVDDIDRKRELDAAAVAARAARARATTSAADRAIRRTETIEAWLDRIGMIAYFYPLFVNEDLLEVELAKSCSAEDLIAVGVDAEDAHVLAHCGGPPPKWLVQTEKTAPSNEGPRTRARTAMDIARATAASSSERLWDVARGADGRGRGESLPSIDRFRRHRGNSAT